MARHKGRKKTLALPNRPKPLGVVRSLTDEFVKRGMGNGGRGMLTTKYTEYTEMGDVRVFKVAWEGRAPARPLRTGMGGGI